MTTKFFIFISIGLCFFYSCGSTKDYKLDLESKNVAEIDEAAAMLGKTKDTSAVVPLLTHIKDPRMTGVVKYKGMTCCYCRLCALKQISGIQPDLKLNQFIVDTAAINFYMDWALSNGYIKNKSDIQLD